MYKYSENTKYFIHRTRRGHVRKHYKLALIFIIIITQSNRFSSLLITDIVLPPKYPCSTRVSSKYLKKINCLCNFEITYNLRFRVLICIINYHKKYCLSFILIAEIHFSPYCSCSAPVSLKYLLK